MTMPDETRERCRKLRMRSKRGEFISPEDFKFLESCWQRWPEEYKAMQREVFVDTAPFGSQLRSAVETSAMQGSFGVHASTSGATHKGVVDEPCSIKPGDNNA
jgi:hypothetical protein